jgi:fructose-1,6-bisphosphatase/sedoheptulose 1,7-bisphosphatase-like protein
MGQATATSPIRSPSKPCAARWTRVPIDGTIVIGEGERDEAPMLYIGEKVGMAVRGETGANILKWISPSIRSRATNLCATGAPTLWRCWPRPRRAVLLHAPDIYMEKLIVGPSSRDVVDLDAPVRLLTCAPSLRRSGVACRTSSSSCSIVHGTRN